MKTVSDFTLLSFISSLLLLGALAQEQCGSNVGGAVCPGGLCCSKFGFCGNAPEYCGDGCQSQCTPGSGGGATPTPTPTTPTPTPSGGGGDLSSLISEPLFNDMLKNRNGPGCAGAFYTYNSFITAAGSFSGFATTGDTDTRKKELAAFFGQTSHETTGGAPNTSDGGYCFVEEINKADYCTSNAQFPCAPGKKYYGRGPIQLTGNNNYGLAGNGINADLLGNPELLATDPVLSFKSAIWFWMTPQDNKPSSHNVITGQWTPSPADNAAGRVPGYGVITNIINGGIECGMGPKDAVQDRIGFYTRYCTLFNVSPGDNLDCNNQKNFAMGK